VCRYTTLWNVSVLKATIKNNTTSVTKYFDNRKQRVYCLSYHLKKLSHPAVLRQMFNIYALLLDDAILKCLVTEVVLISIVAIKTLHKVVYRHTWGMVGSVVTVLLEMFSWFWQWNKFETRSIFDEIMAYKSVCQFLEPLCIWTAVSKK